MWCHTHSQQMVTHSGTLLQKVLRVFSWKLNSKLQKSNKITFFCAICFYQQSLIHHIQNDTDSESSYITHSDPSPTNWAVSLGSVLRSGVGALVIPIQRVVIHPAFNGTNMDHDVALLELTVPAPTSYTIQSVCLPSPVHHFLKTAECYITGWGSMREGGERFKIPQTSGTAFQTTGCEMWVKARDHWRSKSFHVVIIKTQKTNFLNYHKDFCTEVTSYSSTIPSTLKYVIWYYMKYYQMFTQITKLRLLACRYFLLSAEVLTYLPLKLPVAPPEQWNGIWFVVLTAVKKKKKTTLHNPLI